MNITYILGNGFDIQLGLKSRYSDFLEEYVKPKDGDSENVRVFREYLKKRPNCKWWSDVEKAMGEDLGRFSNETIGNYTEQMMSLERELFDYLKEEQDKCSWERIHEINNTFVKFLRASFSGMFNNTKIDMWPKNNQFRFISLNYTNTIEMIIKCCKNNKGDTIFQETKGRDTYRDTLGEVCHVHGDLESQIIMGVNDESQLTIGSDLTLTDELRWQLIKGDMSTAANMNREIKAKQLISDSTIIALYGVSYGETDARWWNEIITWLKGDGFRKVVAFVYEENMTFDARAAWEAPIYEKRKKEEILRKLGINDESLIEKLKPQLYIIQNTKLLNLQELIYPEKAIAAMKETDKSEV